jgi:ABC-2 type transport system ATP-binding protein
MAEKETSHETQEIALKVDHICKDFKLPHERKNSIKESILNFKKQSFDQLHALRDINFEVKRGEFFGIVGRNGSGKSTLLKLIGGIYQPTKGNITVNGTLTPFIELGIGFNPELTGRENVFLNGAILGLTRKEITAKYNEIVEFAELHKFMDQKLKNYSSGMQVRLAFSIAIQAHNDILLIDEVLAVGDTAFQRKCFNVFKDVKRLGKTVIFVTHDMGAVQEFCDRALMIQDSRVVMLGEPREVALRYQLANTIAGSESGASVAELQRPKNPAIKIQSAEIKKNGRVEKNFTISDDIQVDITLEVRRPMEAQVNCFVIRSDGSYMNGVNTNEHLGVFNKPKGTYILRCTLDAGQIIKGDYSIGIGIYTPGFVPDLIDIVDRGYAKELPQFSIVDASSWQDGVFYLQGSWSQPKKK